VRLWDSRHSNRFEKWFYVFARGATDNKGQILSHILGVQEKSRRPGSPVNCICHRRRGEIGQRNLGNFLSQNRARLKPEVVVVFRYRMISRGVPTMSYGLRGVQRYIKNPAQCGMLAVRERIGRERIATRRIIPAVLKSILGCR